jgi:tetratricopeptide (TPR) repeat protein
MFWTWAVSIIRNTLRAFRRGPERAGDQASASTNQAEAPSEQSHASVARALRARWREAERAGSADEWSRLGRELMRSGEYQQAIDASSRAVEADPSQLDAWRCLAISHEQLAEHEDSRAAWGQVDALSGISDRARASRAEQARDRVRTEPASPQTWRRLAVSHGRAGRHVEAIELAEAALARDPSIHPALIPLVEEVLNIAPGAVWSLLETMRRLAPEDVQYMHLAGVVGAKAGRGEEAFELMREAVRRRAEEPTWWYALGRALQAEGGPHRQEAMLALEKAVQLKPDYDKARGHLEALRRVLGSTGSGT